MSLLLETLDLKTGDAGKSKVCKEVTTARSLANWVLWSSWTFSCTAGLTLGVGEAEVAPDMWCREEPRAAAGLAIVGMTVGRGYFVSSVDNSGRTGLMWKES